MKVFSFVLVQQRWQMRALTTLLVSALPAVPASMRKPWYLSVTAFHTKARLDPAHLLERRRLPAGDIVDSHATIIDQPALWPSISHLRHADIAAVLVLEEHDCRPVV